MVKEVEVAQQPGSEARILEAAEKIFMRDGYDGARMQAIAESAGINKALLHYYFRSKDKLFEQVLLKWISAFLPVMTTAFASQPTTHQRIEAFVDGYLKFLTTHPQLPMFILYSINRHPEFVQHLPRTIFEVVTTAFNADIAAGRMKAVDPAHLLISILSMCIFPFIAKPMAMHMMQKSEDAYAEFLAQRKPEIMKIISAMTTP